MRGTQATVNLPGGSEVQQVRVMITEDMAAHAIPVGSSHAMCQPIRFDPWSYVLNTPRYARGSLVLMTYGICWRF